MHRANGSDKILAGHSFEQIRPGACLQRAVDVFVAVVRGEHDEPRLRRLHADALDHVHAAHPRQPQVDQGDIGLVLAKLRDGLYAVGGFAHHLQAVCHIQQRHQSLANHVVVLHNQHSD